MATIMKIKHKPIESVRIKPERGLLLKQKSFELTIKAGTHVSEADIVNYLIDTFSDKVTFEKEELKLDLKGLKT
jgi:hypothetical protein